MKIVCSYFLLLIISARLYSDDVPLYKKYKYTAFLVVGTNTSSMLNKSTNIVAFLETTNGVMVIECYTNRVWAGASISKFSPDFYLHSVIGLNIEDDINLYNIRKIERMKIVYKTDYSCGFKGNLYEDTVVGPGSTYITISNSTMLIETYSCQKAMSLLSTFDRIREPWRDCIFYKKRK